jgi:hypothetical protein
MGGIRLSVLAFALCVAIAAAATPAAAEPAPGSAGWIFDPGKVVVVDLTLSPDAEDELETEPDEYVEGGFAISTTSAESSVTVPDAPSAPIFRVGRSKRDAAALATHLWLSGPGVVSQTATIKTAHGPRNACSAHAAVQGEGTWTLRCPLSPEVLRRLSVHGLSLKVRTRFVPQGSGDSEQTFRRVHLARIAE